MIHYTAGESHQFAQGLAARHLCLGQCITHRKQIPAMTGDKQIYVLRYHYVSKKYICRERKITLPVLQHDQCEGD